MFDIKKHLKKAGIINSVLICIAIACGFMVMMTDTIDVNAKYSIPIHMIALLVGLVYSLGGYKKDSASYYKIFMLCGSFSYLTTLVCGLQGKPQGLVRAIGIATLTINLIIMLILAFGKDLGKTKSLTLVFATFGLNVISAFVFAIKEEFSQAGFPVVVNILQLTVISIIACLFVEAKYADKANRGRE